MIRDLVEDRKSSIARQTVNKVSRKNSTTKAKLKAISQEVWIQLWKQYFENLLGTHQKLHMNQSQELLVIN